MSELSRAVSRIARWFKEVYALDLELDLARCVVEEDQAAEEESNEMVAEATPAGSSEELE